MRSSGRPASARRWAAVLTAGLAVTGTGSWVAATAATRSAAPVRTVTYHGLRLQVPADWPLVDLAAAPSTCVRFDRHAVYLGHPGSAQQCPGGLRGKVDGLLIEPVDTSTARSAGTATVTVPAGAALPGRLPDTVDHSVTIDVQGAGVLVTAAYGADPSVVSGIVAGGTVSSAGSQTARVAARAATPKTPSGPTFRAAATPVVAPGTFTGAGFDTCAAPNSTTMDAWLANSPYRATVVYIGGAAEGCPQQPELTADWVARQTSNGWHLLPVYVGLQAPCSKFLAKINPAQASTQGAAAASDAVAQAAALGMAPGSVITFDMESYTPSGTCSTPVLQFLSAWTTRLHALGYGSSVYSSALAAMVDLVQAYDGSSYVRPDQVFIANWRGPSNTTDDPLVPSTAWPGNRRARQYQGPHDETYGSIKINIDNDYINLDQALVDLTPPAVSFSPASGALRRGTVPVAVSASDASGFTRMELLVNGAVVGTDPAAPWTFSWASGTRTGRISLGVRAYDRYGNATLVQHSVVVDNTRPTLAVTAPKNGARVSGTVKLTATATDTYGVARVELWINGRRVASDATKPYAFSIASAKYGRTLTVQVRAYDKAGNLTTSTRTWHR